jgi:hypothetical protein
MTEKPVTTRGPSVSRVVRAATDINPKVKVPAVVGLLIACILAVLAILSTVPALAFYVSIGMAIVTTAGGYFVYGD